MTALSAPVVESLSKLSVHRLWQNYPQPPYVPWTG